MDATTHNLCESCHWWHLKLRGNDPHTRDGSLRPYDLGECRKRPPTTHPKPDGRVFTHWPTTRGSEFCGSFTARASTQKPAPAETSNPTEA